jgi:AMP nucleosidase
MKEIKPTLYSSADEAFDAVQSIYEDSVAYLQGCFSKFSNDELAKGHYSAYYPYIRITTDEPTKADARQSYGSVPSRGTYEITLTRPDIYDYYYKTQFALLLKNHNVSLEVGVSDTPIPIHFALGENFHVEQDLTPDRLEELPLYFDRPDLNIMDDEIANCRYEPKEDEGMPLALFTAPRVDISLQRLRHYTGTPAKHFQNFVLFTNYQFYIDEFIKLGHQMMAGAAGASDHLSQDYVSFVEPGDVVTYSRVSKVPDEMKETHGGRVPVRMPQMPAYHLKRADGSGITMINIGVGPSNAKTITDHVAVLRPHAWLMLGHCAGLRNTQKLGDYVLAHGYLRLDHVLDRDLPPEIPVPALAEVQQALEEATGDIVGLSGYDVKRVMRTGTVATIDDRNWELQPSAMQNLPLSQSRAIALDMESGTIAANGFRFRVPYGTLLCVSDKPLHGQLKLPGMADNFYRERVNQHLQIGLLTMEKLRAYGIEKLHSRKLRSFSEVAFQ